MNTSRTRSTWIHILFWGTLWAIIPILLSEAGEDSTRAMMRGVIVFFGVALVVWLNINQLLPNFFFERKEALYILLGLALVVLVTAFVYWDHAPWAEYFTRSGGRNRGPRPTVWKYFRYIYMMMPFFTAFIGSAMFEIAGFANRVAREAATIKSEKLETEMKFLKSQINPHFLFNALNNIYSLAVLKSERTPDNLLKLSGMLRYVLYDCKAEQVPLKREVEYLRNFIDLSMLKDSRGLNVEAELEENVPDVKVAPMLFVPFVENAFKHSRVEDLEKGWIKISLKADDSTIRFQVSNSVPEGGYTKDKSGGIGLENVRRRLELLSPGRHKLEINQKPDRFEVSLVLDLNE